MRENEKSRLEAIDGQFKSLRMCVTGIGLLNNLNQKLSNAEGRSPLKLICNGALRGEKRVPQYVLLDHLAPIWMVSSGYTYQQTSCFLTHIQVTEASFVGNDLLYELSLLFSNMCTMVNSSLDNNVVVHWKKSRNFWWLRERGVYWRGGNAGTYFETDPRGSDSWCCSLSFKQ